MAKSLPGELTERCDGVACRSVSVADGDRGALAELMLDAFRGTIDDEGEDLAGALAEVDRTVAGEYGEYLAEFSLVIERDDQLISACLITLFEGAPWLSCSMTRRSCKRQGLARVLLIECMHRLAAHGYTQMGLIVTVGNTAAQAMYRSLGFVEQV